MNVDALRSVVGPANVLVDLDQRSGYETDWTRRFSGHCDAVVRPSSVSHVREVLQWCSAHQVAVVTQGGNTGLVGGGVPDDSPGPRIVLSTRGLDDVREVDTVGGSVVTGAGVTLQALEERLRGTGWEFGVDLSARGSATLGGMVATNAGGTRVLRDGTMRANVLGAEAVLANGALLSHLAGLLKDNTGYDWPGLLCGSEGTLGVVTAVRLRLVPERPDRVCVAVRCDGWADAVGLASGIRRAVEGIEVIEAIDFPGAHLAQSVLGVRTPFADAPVTLWMVWAGTGEAPSLLADLVSGHEHLVGAPAELMAARDRQSEAIATTGIPHKMDVTVPLRAIAAFAEDVTARVRQLLPAAEVYVFGHLGDGNLHVNVVGPGPDDERVDDTVLQTVVHYGGSISAEHGIGRVKAKWLGLSRNPAEIDLMRSIKRSLDPLNILNPGVLLAD